MNKENIFLIKEAMGVTFKYELSPSDVVDDRALDRARNVPMEGIAPVQFTEMEGKKVIISRIPTGTPLNQFIKKLLKKA